MNGSIWHRVTGALAMAALLASLMPGAASAGTAEVCDAAFTAADFTDVDEGGGTFGPSIACVAGYDIVGGFPDGTYQPGAAVTRAQAAKFVVNFLQAALGAPLPLPATNPFDDVDADGTFGPFILKLVQAGIIDGVDADTYGPDGFLTRGQMSKIVAGALEYLGVPLDDSDADSTDDVDNTDTFGRAINSLLNAAIVTGKSDGDFHGADDVTRGQLALFVTNAAGAADELDLWFPTSSEAEGGAGTAYEGQVTAKDAGANSYTIVLSDGATTKTVVYDDANDKFFEDGSPVTLGVFESRLHVGDSVKLVDDATTTDVDRHYLTNAGTVTSGTVGAVNLSAGSFAIITPANVIIKTWLYNGGTTFVVDGATVVVAILEEDLSLGDTVAIQNTDGDNTDAEKVTLTNRSVTGLVSAAPTLAGTTPNRTASFTLGALGDSPYDGTDAMFVVSEARFAPTASQSASIGGTAGKTYADVEAALSRGDQVTYSRKDGVESFAIINKAPAKVTGTVTETFDGTGAGGSVTSVSGSTRTTSTYTAGARFFIDGVEALESELEAAVAAGAGFAYQAGDAATSTVERVDLTSQDLTGLAASITSAGTLANGVVDETLDIETSGGGVIYDDYALSAVVAPRWFVNGTEVVYSQFEQYLARIQAEQPATAPNDTITVVEGGVATDVRLVTDNTL